jgi:hypothetical protein
MHYFIAILIITLANESFTLIPWYHVKGVFNVVDLGILLVFLALVGVSLKARNLRELGNPLSVFVALHLFLILIHVANAMVNYDQTLVSTLIRSRHQFYYLSYFYFLLVFDTAEKFERLMDLLTLLALALIALAVVNYFWPVVFHHELYGEGHGERGGIKRAYVPGMDIVGMTFLWQLLKFLQGGHRRGGAAVQTLLLFCGLLFRQTRGRIIAATAIAGWMLLRSKRIGLVIGMGFFVAVLAVVVEFTLPENIFLDSFSSAVTDITEEEGTWAPRQAQIETAWRAFAEHPVLGSGAILIRKVDGAALTKKELSESYQADLGWAHWLKNFGIAGMVWMTALTTTIYFKRRSALKGGFQSRIGDFGWFQWLHLLVGMATIGYFFRANGITIVSLTLAMLTRTYFLGWTRSARDATGVSVSSTNTGLLHIARKEAIGAANTQNNNLI